VGSRVFLAMMQQESNTLSPRPATLERFRDRLYLAGDAIASGMRGTATEIGGALAEAESNGIEVVPSLAAGAVSSGPVTGDAFEQIVGTILGDLARAGHVDAIVLVLHGAMVVDGYEDGTGELLARVRAAVGAKMPIVGTLDLHANVTSLMAESATVLVGFHTYPHVDLFDVGRKAMRLAKACAEGSAHPVHSLRRLPMILPAENASTTTGPYAELMAHVEDVERQPGVLAASAYQTQPWLNVRDMRCSVLVYTDRDQAAAESHADDLARHFWSLRHRFYDFELVPVREAVRRALAEPAAPVVLADGADGSGSGSTGDSTAILQALIAERPGRPCFVSIVDPRAATACATAGVGQQITLDVGGRLDPKHYRSITVSGSVKALSDGVFTFKGPQFTGQEHDRGLTAVLAIGSIRVAITTATAFNWDPEYYRSLGLEPRDAQVVVVKSPTAYRAAYAGLMTDSILVDGPGASSANIRALESEFDRVSRPIYPFDNPSEEVALRATV
jgi:microcystin degradation protein MlrC